MIVLLCSDTSQSVELRQEKKGLEKLIDQIFNYNGYNELVRPVNNATGQTHVSTELKLLGIDLVSGHAGLIGL